MALLPGVYLAQKKNGCFYYRSSITYRNKHISLGSYKDEQGAHNAYHLADQILNVSSDTIESYHKYDSVISYEKWIILINFRDNGIYFKTPIYLRKSFFEYYLSPDDILKFSIDDLFYYSNHKIMKRGGHLFVADFGMQVNILSRYGIKNFGVPGRDYIFMNGDTSDFQYENICIINKYHGVMQTLTSDYAVKKPQPTYLCKIHINGDYIIGRYSTEEEAAVAYNKAAHLLKQKGLNKSFPLNYIEDITPEEYLSIYNQVKISRKIMEYNGNK